MRVVFDTNILVSALVVPGGRGEAALQRILEAQDELILSKAVPGGHLKLLHLWPGQIPPPDAVGRVEL